MPRDISMDDPPPYQTLYESDKGEEAVEIRHPQREKSVSSIAAFLNIVKMNVGIGVLSMPNAVANAGWGLGAGSMALLNIMTIHCMLLLVRSAQTICRRSEVQFLDYAGSVESLFKSVAPVTRFSKCGRLTVDVFLLISNIGGFAVYSLFIAQNLEKVLSSASFNVHWDYRAYLLIILAPTMVLCSIRKIANLTWIMIFANCCEFYVISVVLYYYFRSPLPDIATRSVVGPVDRIPVFFGSVMFALSGVGIVLPLENKMKRPESLGGIFGVLSVAMTLVSTLYIFVGFFGYWRYGDDMRLSGSVTLNLPQDEWVANSARIVSSLAITLTNPLQFYVALTIIIPYIGLEQQTLPIMKEYIVRYSIILICFGLAAAVKRLDLFVALFGSVTTAALAIVIPCVMDILARYPTVPVWVGVKNTSIIIVGVTGSVLGTAISIKDLANS